MECDRCVDRRGPRRDRAQLHYLKLRKTRGLREHVPGHLSKRIKASFEQVVTGRLMTTFGRKAAGPLAAQLTTFKAHQENLESRDL